MSAGKKSKKKKRTAAAATPTVDSAEPVDEHRPEEESEVAQAAGGHPRDETHSCRDLHDAMSTCAGCGAALDRSDGHGSRECPNCKIGESIEGRHFFCSKACFTSSWKQHRQLHVRERRTVTGALPEGLPGANPVADFGSYTDEEWRDFQLSSEYAAALDTKLEASLDVRREEVIRINDNAERYLTGLDMGLCANLDVVCSNRRLSFPELQTAMCGIFMAIGLIETRVEQKQPDLALYSQFESAILPNAARSVAVTPNTMFEILRRNYLYHVSLLAFQPHIRVQIVVGPSVQEEVENILHEIMCSPMPIFDGCFAESLCKYSVANTLQQSDVTSNKLEKRIHETFALVCPMYVCAFVATLLHQMWDGRLAVGEEEADRSRSPDDGAGRELGRSESPDENAGVGRDDNGLGGSGDGVVDGGGDTGRDVNRSGREGGSEAHVVLETSTTSALATAGTSTVSEASTATLAFPEASATPAFAIPSTSGTSGVPEASTAAVPDTSTTPAVFGVSTSSVPEALATPIVLGVSTSGVPEVSTSGVPEASTPRDNFEILTSGVPQNLATAAEIVQRKVTGEESARLAAGLLKILSRKLPSFWNTDRHPRGSLNFRDFLKGVNGRGALEGKMLGRLEKICRRGHPKSTQRMGTGQVDLAAAEALYLTAQLCLGLAAAHGPDHAAHTQLLDDVGLVRWALQQWEARTGG